MSDPVDRTVVTFEGRSPPGDPAEALSILSRIDAFDPPAEYDVRVSNVSNLDADSVGDARLLWGDHRPTVPNPTAAEPHVFVAGYHDGRVRVAFRTTLAAVETFEAALEAVFEATPLEVDQLSATVELDEARPLDLEDLSVPVRGGALSTREVGGQTTAVELSVGGRAVEDPTGQFSVTDAFEGVTESVRDQATDVAGPVAGETVSLHGLSPPLDPETAADLLERARAFDPPYDRTTDPGAVDADSARGAQIAWGDVDDDAGEGGEGEDDPDPGVRELLSADPPVLSVDYGGYDHDGTDRASVVARVPADETGVVDDLLERVYPVADLWPRTLELTVETESDHEFELDAVDVPEEYTTLARTGSVTVSTDPVEDTAATPSLSAVLGDPARDLADQVRERLDDGPVDWDRVADLRADLDPGAENPGDPVREYHRARTATDPERGAARLTAVAHPAGVYDEQFLRERGEFADPEADPDREDPAAVETTVVAADLDPEAAAATLEEYDAFAMAAMLGVDRATLSDLARRERVAVVAVDADGVEGHSLVATDDGDWRILV